jgi:UDP-3-O-[3-hydroxymyristoyl] N-acetylglucosamine deacetylase/3-hydroxyacyl-[acyl-carrier-protein] dehydratase
MPPFRNQKTIKAPVEFDGVGLHTGTQAKMVVQPADANYGIRFFKRETQEEIFLSPQNISSTNRGTTLKGAKGSLVHTVEHFLASVGGLELDNLRVEIQGDEIPILDGSAWPFLKKLKDVGFQEQSEIISPVIIQETKEWKFDNTLLKVEPADQLILDVKVSFPYPGMENQSYLFTLKNGNFETELARARTFCFEDEIEILKSQGLIKGGSLDCALVIGKQGVLNGPLRYSDELVRHKTLDLLGDLMILNRPILGKISIVRGGHKYHFELVKKIEEMSMNHEEMSVNHNDTIQIDFQKSERLLNINEIQKLIPHRYPFLLVDRILELVPYERAVGIKNVSINEPFFQGHFPQHAVMPGVLIIEALAQVAGVAFFPTPQSTVGQMMYLAGIDSARFRKPVFPGDQIRLVTEIVLKRGKMMKASGKAYVDGQLVTEAEFRCILVDVLNERA